MGAADRVRKLAALAGSDNVHEATEAARQACRLIREGKVTISDPVAERAPRGEPFPGAWNTYGWAPPPPAPRAPRPAPRGPFARRPGVSGAQCAACQEEIPYGDAFSCADGYVHGDCVPASSRP